jgi:hypothetical protein
MLEKKSNHVSRPVNGKTSSSQKTYRLDLGKLSEQIGTLLLELALFCSESVEFGRRAGGGELTFDIAQLLTKDSRQSSKGENPSQSGTYRLCRCQSRFQRGARLAGERVFARQIPQARPFGPKVSLQDRHLVPQQLEVPFELFTLSNELFLLGDDLAAACNGSLQDLIFDLQLIDAGGRLGERNLERRTSR